MQTDGYDGIGVPVSQAGSDAGGTVGFEGAVVGDLIYLLIVVLFFILSIGYARIAPRL